MIDYQNISIIIPVSPQETELQNLQRDLEPISSQAEILVIPGNSRAQQLNQGATRAQRKFLWFLHADSRFTKDTTTALLHALNNHPEALHYFRLRFLPDGPPLMFLNELGCRIRSNLIGAPFGDQGFCISRENFARCGGFTEDVAYGEDHVFVWKAHQHGIDVRPTGGSILTSARRYREQGWLNTTWRYHRMWTAQAKPEKLKLHRIRNKQISAIAVFVKTPGVTPLKTRLAASVGQAAAHQLYLACLKTIQGTLESARTTSLDTIEPYWAIAEASELNSDLWKDFPRISQGEGTLGDRLYRVYNHLQSHYGRVVLLGADAPQITTELLLQVHHLLNQPNRFAIGPANDGGFYIFAGSSPLPRSVWESVTYSSAATYDQLTAQIKPFGETIILPPLTDLDHFEDLPLIWGELSPEGPPSHMALREVIAAYVERPAL